MPSWRRTWRAAYAPPIGPASPATPPTFTTATLPAAPLPSHLGHSWVTKRRSCRGRSGHGSGRDGTYVLLRGCLLRQDVERLCDAGRVWLIIDGERYELSDAYGDLAAEQKRIEQAIFRCEVEQIHLADGRRVLVNWRAVRFASVEE